MASAAEQLLAHLSWKSWAQAKDLHKRIWFTMLIFLVYRLGTYIPLPGVNGSAMHTLAQEHAGKGLLAMFNMVSGGALERMSIFALNLMPNISASIIVQLLTAISPHFIALKKEGESGKRKLGQYTRYGTVALACFQAIGLASALSAQNFLVYQPGLVFYASTLVTIVGATLFLMWLGEQITKRGIGNGSSMIIYAGIMASLPRSMVQTLEQGRAGTLPWWYIPVLGLFVVTIIAFIVFMERAYRKISVQYPKRQVGQKIYAPEQTYMPLKLNISGVLAPIFAAVLLGFVKLLLTWPLFHSIPIIGRWTQAYLTTNSVWLMVIQVSLIIFFCFFYTTIVFNPEETAESLRKNGAFIPGYRPGAMTRNYLIYVIDRLTVLGSTYIAFVAVLPDLLSRIFQVQFPFQGTSFLIAVSVSLELISQIHSYIISHQYGSLLRNKVTKG